MSFIHILFTALRSRYSRSEISVIDPGISLSTRHSARRAVVTSFVPSAASSTQMIAEDTSPVYLELSGLGDVLVEVLANRTCVRMELPRHLAEKLGLLPCTNEPPEVVPDIQGPPEAGK